MPYDLLVVTRLCQDPGFGVGFSGKDASKWMILATSQDVSGLFIMDIDVNTCLNCAMGCILVVLLHIYVVTAQEVPLGQK